MVRRKQRNGHLANGGDDSGRGGGGFLTPIQVACWLESFESISTGSPPATVMTLQISLMLQLGSSQLGSLPCAGKYATPLPAKSP